MERLTKRINGHAHGAEGRNKDNLTGKYCRGKFEATACVDKLAEYEDLEEQEKLLRLSCAVGDTVYEVQRLRKRIQPYEIVSIKIGRYGERYYYWELKNGCGIYGNLKGFGDKRLGLDVFLTQVEAEAALEKLKEDKGK